MKKFIITLLVVAALFGSLGTITMLATPGDSTDPIITLSYIENILKGEMSFKVVELNKGQKLTGDAGAELVLRMGSATIFSTPKGGLADLTTGTDLGDSTKMPANHHLIVPVADGRGVSADTDIILLVKGDYEIN